MTPPSDFLRELARDCPHLRVRWSLKRQTWQVEQQVGVAQALPPIRIDEGRDDLIRARDGYAFVMEVAPGDRVPCPKCGLTVKLPHLETREVPCTYCRGKGRDATVIGGYWPLGDALLQHLRRTNPFRPSSEGEAVERMARESDAYNANVQRLEEEAARQHGEDVLFDALIHQIPKVGYTRPTSTPV